MKKQMPALRSCDKSAIQRCMWRAKSQLQSCTYVDAYFVERQRFVRLTINSLFQGIVTCRTMPISGSLRGLAIRLRTFSFRNSGVMLLRNVTEKKPFRVVRMQPDMFKLLGELSKAVTVRKISVAGDKVEWLKV